MGQCSKNYRTFLPKYVSLTSQKYGFGIRDPGSGKNLFRLPDPGSGSRGQKCTGSRIRIRNTAWKVVFESGINPSGSTTPATREMIKDIRLSASVADPGCLSLIPDQNFSIPDPSSRVQKISLFQIQIRIKEFKYF